MNPGTMPQHEEPTATRAVAQVEPSPVLPTPAAGSGRAASAHSCSCARHVLIPSDRLYWSLVEAPGLPTDRRGRLRVPSAVLAELMQSDLPVEATQVHAVGVRLDAGWALLCAADHEALRGLPEGVQTAIPNEAPAWTGVAPTSSLVAALNLLSGVFEPTSLRHQRARLYRSVTFAAAIMLLLVCVGTWRREQAYATFSRLAQKQADSTLMKADPSAATPSAAMLHLRAQREHLQSAVASFAANSTRCPDAAITLAGLLSSWPASDETRTELISLAPTAGTIIMVTEADPKTLVTGFRAPPGWKLDEPRIAATRDGTQITLQMKPEGAGR